MSDKNKSFAAKNFVAKNFVAKSREMYITRISRQKQVIAALMEKRKNTTSENTEIVFYGGIGPITNTYASRSAAMYRAYMSK